MRIQEAIDLLRDAIVQRFPVNDSTDMSDGPYLIIYPSCCELINEETIILADSDDAVRQILIGRTT